MLESHPSERFRGKVALVTGAAQGIGEAVAQRLAREGASVVVADIDRENCERVAAEIQSQGGQAAAWVGDLSRFPDARQLVQYTLETYSRVDVAVHNVGGTIWSKPFWEYAPEEIEKEIDRSLWPALWCCRAVLPHLLERRAGVIVNIGSVAVRSSFRVPYGAAKAGVHAMTACLAEELGDCGVRVNCVAPGGIDVGHRPVPRNPGPLSPEERAWKAEMAIQTQTKTTMKRYGTPAEVASAVCYLASDEASYITGEVLYVAGGYHR